MRLILFQPDIPQNTGTILRLAACLSVGVDIIGPAGFDWSDRAMRRAGLDYLDHVALQRHIGWESFLSDHKRNPDAGRLILLTTQAEESYCAFSYAADDCLILGRESSGVPDDVHRSADHRVTIPLAPGRRSLNVAVAAAMVVGEALRQTDGFPRPAAGAPHESA
ncbi:MAG: tRNA (cytidine(34)-2'-O)-methyltransferase [Hyphomicrobiaceae bacterium]